MALLRSLPQIRNDPNFLTWNLEKHANLLTYLTNWPLYTPENGFWGIIKCQGSPFLSFAQAFSVLIVRIDCQNGSHKARLRKLSITQLWAWPHRRSAYAQLSPLYLLSTLYVTHMIKYSRPSTAFLYCKRRKAGRGLGTRLLWWLANVPSIMIFIAILLYINLI